MWACIITVINADELQLVVVGCETDVILHLCYWVGSIAGAAYVGYYHL
jgi:hypothetical protein